MPFHSPVTRSTACSTSVSPAGEAQRTVSQHHLEIKGYSSCWWLIDTQVTGCMSKLPIRATSLKSYIFPQVTIACVFAIFSFKAVSGHSQGYTFGLIFKRHGGSIAGYWGLLEVTTGPLNDKIFSFSHTQVSSLSISSIHSSILSGSLSAVVICCLLGPFKFSTQTVIRYLGQINRIASCKHGPDRNSLSI